MAKKPSTPADAHAIPEAPPAPPPVTEPPVSAAEERLEQELAEVRELTRTLMAAIGEARAQNVRSEAVRDAIQEVRADVRAASQAMLMATPPASALAAHGGEPSKECGPCECVSSNCCCFDIIISWARAAKPQIEPADMGDIGPFINALEVQLYFEVNNIGFLYPALGMTADFRADGAPGGPGPKVTIARTVNRVCFPKGTTQTVQVDMSAREHDEGVERPIGMKDEIGEGTGWITLDCCMDTIYPAMPVEIPLVYGGEGRGMMQVAFYAKRVCC